MHTYNSPFSFFIMIISMRLQSYFFLLQALALALLIPLIWLDGERLRVSVAFIQIAVIIASTLLIQNAEQLGLLGQSDDASTRPVPLPSFQRPSSAVDRTPPESV